MDAGGLDHVVVSHGKDRRLVRRAGFIKEADLQLLIKESPELLGPLGEGLQFVPIGWEVPLRPGRLDLLLLDSEGVLTLVETKLKANDECRREVVGQVLEYAAFASEWNIDDLRKCFAEFLGSHQAPPDLAGGTLEQALATRFGWMSDEEDERAAKLGQLFEAMARKLQSGHLRIVCGVDERIESLERLVRYLSAHSDLQVVLLQVNRFPVDGNLVVLVPSLHGDVEVTPARRASDVSKPLTVQEVVDSFIEAEERSVVAGILKTARDAGASFAPGPSGLSIRVKCPIKKEPVTVAWVFAPGKPAWMKTRDLSFGHGLDYPNTDPTLLAILEVYYKDLVSEHVGSEASSKGVHARWVTPREAGERMGFLAARLTKVIKDISALSPVLA